MRIIKRLMKGGLSKDRKGGIEGLPLQLIIIIMVATIGAGIILGWMGNVDNPKYIGGVQPITSNIQLVNGETDGFEVTVVVTDQDGDPLERATVILTGLGITDGDGKVPCVLTDVDGEAAFENLDILMKHSTIGYITVNVSAPEHGEHNTTRIPVISVK